MQNTSRADIKQRTYQFSLDIIVFCQKLPKGYASHVICNQLLRAATSIGANVVEAKCASSKREFAKFYRISLKSANETQYWLGLLRDSDIDVDSTNVDTLINEVVEICRILAKSLLTMSGKT